uniref:Uncharacterized protein n=1 Tax=Oryza glumipatula TaxID=40148 RepID=A0A0D9ZUS2_9ORYZ
MPLRLILIGSRASGATALRWPGGGNVGGELCSQAWRIQGGRWSAGGMREEAGTADGRARFWPAKGGGWLGCFGRGKEREVGKWIRLVEAELVVRGFGQRSSGEGD